MPLTPTLRSVVTGGGSGLGRAICHEIVRRGGGVVVSDINLEAARETARQLNLPETHAIACDVGKIEEVEHLATQAESLLGGVDLVVNNAGVAVAGRVGEIPLDDWHWIMNVNLWGVIHGCHVFVPRFRKQGHGHILNVASTAGLISAPLMSPYNLTKSGVVAFSESLYAELADERIGVTVLCPTFFRTNIGASARVTGEEAIAGAIDSLMDAATIQAADVARLALDSTARGDLYALPHRDGRIMWGIKRLAPRFFYRMLPKLMNMRRERARKAAAG